MRKIANSNKQNELSLRFGYFDVLYRVKITRTAFTARPKFSPIDSANFCQSDFLEPDNSSFDPNETT